MTMLMRETYYGRHEPAWMAPIREPLPYFVEAPYMGFRESHQYPVHDDSYFNPYSAPSPFVEPLTRIPRSSSSMAALGHYSESPFLEPHVRSGGPLRSASYIPVYAYPEGPYHHDGPPHGPSSNRPTRSSSSIPAYSDIRVPRSESRPKQHKVAPEIELRVAMCCSKCEAKTKDTLRKLPGVTGVKTDRRTSKVTVSGKVDPQVVLKTVQKSKKKADFWTKNIYSDAFINFIQSKTGRAQPEEEVTSSFHQHLSSDEGESHHAYDDSEHLSSYEEYSGYSGRDGHDSYDEIERGHSHAPFEASHAPYEVSHTPYEEDDYTERKRGYYNQHTYGPRADISPYGMSSSYGYREDSYSNRDDNHRHETHGTPYYDHFGY